MVYESERYVTVLRRREVKDDFSIVSWQVWCFDLLCLGIHPKQHVLGEVNGKPVWESEVFHHDCSSLSAVHVGPLDRRCRAPVRPENNSDGKWGKTSINPSIFPPINPSTHPSIHSSLHFTRRASKQCADPPLIHLPTYQPIDPLIHSSIHPSIYSLVHSFILSFSTTCINYQFYASRLTSF